MNDIGYFRLTRFPDFQGNSEIRVTGPYSSYKDACSMPRGKQEGLEPQVLAIEIGLDDLGFPIFKNSYICS